MTILAVDNNRHRLTQLSGCLRSVFPGETVLDFTDPLLAAQYGFHHSVDVLFTEISMRGMDGHKLSEGVRKRNRALKVIYISEPEPEKTSVCDNNPYLARPVTENAIRSLFGQII